MLKTKYYSSDKKKQTPAKQITRNFDKIRSSVSKKADKIVLSKKKKLSAFCTNDILQSYVGSEKVPRNSNKTAKYSIKERISNMINNTDKLIQSKRLDKKMFDHDIVNYKEHKPITFNECKLFMNKKRFDKSDGLNFKKKGQVSDRDEKLYRKTLQKLYDIKPKQETPIDMYKIKSARKKEITVFNNENDYRETQNKFTKRKRKIINHINNLAKEPFDSKLKSPTRKLTIEVYTPQYKQESIGYNPNLVLGGDKRNSVCCVSGNCSSKSLHKIVTELGLKY